MGNIFPITQPNYVLNVLGKTYTVQEDDLENELYRADQVTITGYKVIHGISSRIARGMVVYDQYQRILPVHIGTMTQMEEDKYYFMVDKLPCYDADDYRGRTWDLELKPTDLLKV